MHIYIYITTMYCYSYTHRENQAAAVKNRAVPPTFRRNCVRTCVFPKGQSLSESFFSLIYFI